MSIKRVGFIDGRRVAGWRFPANASPGVGQVMTIVDPSLIAAGTNRGLYINYTQSGAKTGSASVRGLAIDLTISADVPNIGAIDLYRADIDNKAISRLSAIEIYSGNRGNAVTTQYDVMIARNSNAVLTAPGCDAFIYFREHTMVQEESSVLMLQGDNAAEYLIAFGANPGSGKKLLEASAAGESITHRVKVNTTVGVRWIHLHDQ